MSKYFSANYFIGEPVDIVTGWNEMSEEDFYDKLMDKAGKCSQDLYEQILSRLRGGDSIIITDTIFRIE